MANEQHYRNAADGEAPRRRPRPAGQQPQRPRQPRPDGARPQQRRPEGAPQRRPRPETERVTSDVNQRRPRPEYAQQQRRPEGQAPRRPAQQQPQRRPRPENARYAEQPQRRRQAPPPPPQPPKQNRPRKKQRKISYWHAGMALYICIFFVALLFGMHKLWNFLGEYESSRPQYTIDGYVEHLGMSFYDEMLRQKIETLPLSEFETIDSVFETLTVDEVEETQRYTWIKKGDTYSDERPVYYIRYGNAAIATVELEKAGETEQFHFPVWRCRTPQSLMEVATEPQFEIKVSAPDGASISVNGQQVPSARLLETDAAVVLDDAALNFTQQQKAMGCEIDGFYVPPVVAAYDANGKQLAVLNEVDPEQTHQEYVFVPADEIAPDMNLITRMEDLTKAYINYMINKDEATWNNLAVLDKFLVNGSTAYKTLHSMTQDVSWNNPYTAREDKALDISHIKMYSDTCCTCEAHFEIQLTKKVVNDYIGTVRWIMVKGTDGQWRASDFILLQSEDE